MNVQYRLVCTLVAVLLLQCRVVAAETVAPNVGHRLPSMEFEDLEGTTHRVSWSDYEPKATVFVFFEPRCASCFRELVYFDTLIRQARGLNLEVFAVEGSGLEPPEAKEAISRFVRIFQHPAFTVVPDPSYKISRMLNIQSVPSTFLAERHGIVVSRKEGFDNLQAIDLTRKIERLLDVKARRLSPALVRLSIDSEEEDEFERIIELRQKAADPAADKGPLEAGGLVPPFELVDITGAQVSWSPGGGEEKTTVLLFWGALCQPCVAEMAFLDRLHALAGKEGLRVIAVEGTGLAPERVSQVMDRYRKFQPMPSYTIAVDPERRLSQLFGVGGVLPQTFIIDGSGNITYHTDEFLQGGEWTIVWMLEGALGLEAGVLAGRLSPDAAALSPYPVEESPTVLKGIEGKNEMFLASLLEAETLFRNFRYIDAIPHYQRCLEINDKSVPVMERLAEIYERQGERELALSQLERILRLEPGNAEAARRVEKIRKSAGSGPGNQP